MMFSDNTKLPGAVTNKLPRDAYDSFREGANAAHEAGGDYNACIRGGWDEVSKRWRRPAYGNGKWVKRSNEDMGKGEPSSSDVHVPVPLGDKKKKPKPEHKAEAKTLYVRRDVLNGAEIHEWMKAQGFKSALPENDMHVTEAFSKTPVDWTQVQGNSNPVVIHNLPSSAICLKRLGENGQAVVLCFQSPELTERHQYFRNAGASWDYPEYQPHVTLTYQADGVDLDDIEPYRGAIHLGAERFDEIKEDANKEYAEAALSKSFAKQADFLKVDPEQRMVWAWANVQRENGTDVVDLHGDIIDPDDMCKAATEFMENARVALAMHERNSDGGIDTSMHKGVVVHSLPLTKEIAAAFGITLEKEGWAIGIKVYDDEVWEAVKSGKLSAISIGGFSEGFEEAA